MLPTISRGLLQRERQITQFLRQLQRSRAIRLAGTFRSVFQEFASFVGGLGGRDIAPEELFEIAKRMRDAAETGESPPPQLLFTETELREIRKLQAIAHVERAHLETTA